MIWKTKKWQVFDTGPHSAIGFSLITDSIAEREVLVYSRELCYLCLGTLRICVFDLSKIENTAKISVPNNLPDFVIILFYVIL